MFAMRSFKRGWPNSQSCLRARKASCLTHIGAQLMASILKVFALSPVWLKAPVCQWKHWEQNMASSRRHIHEWETAVFPANWVMISCPMWKSGSLTIKKSHGFLLCWTKSTRVMQPTKKSDSISESLALNTARLPDVLGELVG